MVTDYVAERRAAGRAVPADAEALLASAAPPPDDRNDDRNDDQRIDQRIDQRDDQRDEEGTGR